MILSSLAIAIAASFTLWILRREWSWRSLAVGLPTLDFSPSLSEESHEFRGKNAQTHHHESRGISHAQKTQVTNINRFEKNAGSTFLAGSHCAFQPDNHVATSVYLGGKSAEWRRGQRATRSDTVNWIRRGYARSPIDCRPRGRGGGGVARGAPAPPWPRSHRPPLFIDTYFRGNTLARCRRGSRTAVTLDRKCGDLLWWCWEREMTRKFESTNFNNFKNWLHSNYIIFSCPLNDWILSFDLLNQL